MYLLQKTEMLALGALFCNAETMCPRISVGSFSLEIEVQKTSTRKYCFSGNCNCYR